MRFDRESYRKLYVAESAEHRLLSLFSRGLRDYLLRFAMEDGTLLPKSSKPAEDLARVLGAAGSERRMVAHAVTDLIGVGYLSYEDGRLWITRYVDAQEARSPGALRQQRYRDTHRDVTQPVTRDADSNVTNNVTSNRRDETRREIADESGARASAGLAQSEPEPEPKLAICALDLLEKAEKTGIVSEFCEKYRSEAEPIREVIREFVSYWTIGGGMGRKEANWMRKLREHLRRHCEKPGAIEAPGAIEHAKRQPRRGRGGNPEPLSAALGGYVPTEQVPYHQPWRPKQ